MLQISMLINSFPSLIHVNFRGVKTTTAHIFNFDISGLNGAGITLK